MQLFTYRKSTAIQREQGEETIAEERWCIIAACELIAGLWRSNAMWRAQRRVFGPFYVGGSGSARFGEHVWKPCMRLGAGGTKEQAELACKLLQQALEPRLQGMGAIK